MRLPEASPGPTHPGRCSTKTPCMPAATSNWLSGFWLTSTSQGWSAKHLHPGLPTVLAAQDVRPSIDRVGPRLPGTRGFQFTPFTRWVKVYERIHGLGTPRLGATESTRRARMTGSAGRMAQSRQSPSGALHRRCAKYRVPRPATVAQRHEDGRRVRLRQAGAKPSPTTRRCRRSGVAAHRLERQAARERTRRR